MTFFEINWNVLFWKVQGYESPSDVDMHNLKTNAKSLTSSFI